MVSSSGCAWTNRIRRPGRSVAVTRPTLRGGACDDRGVDYPELASRTGCFRNGEPRCVAVSADGARVTFLRSGGPDDPAAALWAFDTDSGAERLICDPSGLDLPVPSVSGIESYATDPAGTLACF